MKKKINLATYSDEQRKMFIQYTGESFYVLHQDIEGMNETATEYSFEAFIKTFNLMNAFFTELALNDKEVALKLLKTKKLNSKIKMTWV